MMKLVDGELEGRGWRAVPVSEFCCQLWHATPRRPGLPRIIAVDGRGGAGKTTLAERLSRATPRSAIVHTDDVSWNHSFFDWAQLMADHVLRPLSRGDGVMWRPPAWIEHTRPGAIHIDKDREVVWVEGTGSSRREFAGLLDAKIWVQVDMPTAERRCVTRTSELPDPAAFFREWQSQERPFLRDQRPWEHADFIVAGTAMDGHNPMPGLVIVAASGPAD